MIALILPIIKQGGWIMWPIIVASLVVWWLGLWKLYTLWQLGRARKRFLAFWGKGQNVDKSTGNRQYDTLFKMQQTGVITKNTFQTYFKEFLFVTIFGMNSGISTIAVWVSVAPLLGLLGTVVGMIETFRVITVFGAGNPAFTAEGISIALLTTEAGLTVAFPGLLLHTFITNRKNHLKQQLLCDGEYLYRQLTVAQQ